jgi:hypothetical protein
MLMVALEKVKKAACKFAKSLGVSCCPPSTTILPQCRLNSAMTHVEALRGQYKNDERCLACSDPVSRMPGDFRRTEVGDENTRDT